jgi:hypothetical protein
VGGWEQAAQLPFDAALSLAEDHLKKETQDVLRHCQVCWHSSLGLYSQGGTPPDPPDADDDDEEEF